jgi:molecular chaperone DnaK
MMSLTGAITRRVINTIPSENGDKMTSPAIGIDLGTTFSSVAVINEAGRPEIVASAVDGERATASAIWFNEDDGVVMVGKEAVEAEGGYPGRVVRWIKRHMGDPEWKFEVDGKSYTSVDLSALILKKVVKDAERTLGPIKKAVVTVPAYFDEVRRRATKDAAEAAGLEVLRIINEPTAAALAFAATGAVIGRSLVFDFGGGTFDVSIVDIFSSDNITVVASDGDHRLGGEDIDDKLAQYASELFEKEHGIRLMDDDVSVRSATQAEAEKIKIALSKISKKPGLFQRDAKMLSDSTIHRSTFEEKILPEFMSRIEMLVDCCLDEANVAISDIEHVLLVGGSTRIPAITTMIKNKFSMDPIVNVHPDEAVALGAAIQAGMLLASSGESDLSVEVQEQLSKKTLRDVTAHSYGTIILDIEEKKLINQILIKKNTPIPVKQTDQFFTTHPGQSVIECTITQGEDKDPEFVTTIDKGDMDLPPDRDAGQKISVTYRYDADGIMSCEFLDVESKTSKEFKLNFENTGSKDAAKRVAFDEDMLDELVID